MLGSASGLGDGEGVRRTQKIIAICSFLLAFAGCGNVQNPASDSTRSVSVAVNPTSTRISNFATQNFTATVTGSPNTAVDWQVNGVTGGSRATGFISNAGLYMAPGGVPTKPDGAGGTSITTVTISAVSQVNSAAVASAMVTIMPQNEEAQAGPVKLGTSGGNVTDIGRKYCCSGTLGALVVINGSQYILSNNHVLAKSDSGNLGDEITQPGLIETNCQAGPATQTVANLFAFYNLQTGALPKVDAALASTVNGAVDVTGDILFLGATQTNGVPDAAPPHAGTGISPMQALTAPHNGLMAKSGRTTGLTCSLIIGTNVAASVDYYKNCGDAKAAFTVNYTDLVMVAGGTFSAAGDSGALIVTQDTADPVALLFGGSDTDSVGNPVGDVLSAFSGAGNTKPAFVGGSAHAVIGCTLPIKPNSATAAQTAVGAESLTKANRARDYSAPTLLANPTVLALGFGRSYDRPGDGAVLLFVERGGVAAGIPHSLNGVPTRIIEGDAWAYRGLLNDKETRQLLQSTAEPQLMYDLLPGQMQKARAVQAAHVTELLRQPGVLGVGISASVDAPGEAALLIYVKHGTAIESIPAEMDGVRTRVRESGPFMAGKSENEPAASCRVRGVGEAKRDGFAVSVVFPWEL
jgi:hypothetical protein